MIRNEYSWGIFAGQWWEAPALSKKQIIGIVLSVSALAVSMNLPATREISQVGMRTIGTLAAFLFLLVTEALPVVAISLLFLGLMPLIGVVDSLNSALYGYAQPIVFFTLASFGIATAFRTTPLSRRILRGILRRFGSNSRMVLLSIMVCCALFGVAVSSVPRCAIFMELSLEFTNLYPDEQDRKRTARAFMIAVPVACMIGGIMTPAGSSVNLIALSQLQQITHISISFVQWMCVGIPIAIVMLPLAWYLIVKMYHPAEIGQELLKAFDNSLDIPEQLDTREKKVILILGSMLLLWIASSWIPNIDVTVVAILGCCIMFFPGINILEIKPFLRDNSWDAFFLVGTVLSIAKAMIDNSVSSAISNALPQLSVSLPILLAFTALFIFATSLVIPVATSLIPIIAVPLINFAANAGADPALIMICAAICAGNCYLLPLDTVPLITYSKGYYSMTDMAKATFWLQIALVILSAIWLPVIGTLFH